MNKSDPETTAPPPIDELAYEQAFSELERIVKSLESEEHSLDESLALFERGQALIQHCAGLLDKAELKVQQIIGDEIIDFPVDHHR